MVPRCIIKSTRLLEGNLGSSKIDGQQRLTTFQIFLSAFRDVCAAEDQQAYADECALYLKNRGIMQDEEIERYKLWPTNLDRKQFSDVIDACSKDELNWRHPVVRRKYQRKPNPRPRMIEINARGEPLLPSDRDVFINRVLNRSRYYQHYRLNMFCPKNGWSSGYCPMAIAA